MNEGRDFTVLVLSFLCMFFLLVLIKIFHKLWWVPTRLQHLMALQGIKGPPYKFIHGNTKEISTMLKEVRSPAMGLSHDIFPRLQPHMHCWTKLYGNIANYSALFLSSLFFFFLIYFFCCKFLLLSNRKDISSVVWSSSTDDHFGTGVDQRGIK